MSPQLENSPNDEQRGGRPQTGGTPLATGRADLLAAGGSALASPFVGLVTGAVAIPFGRARQRFDDGRRGR